MTCSRTHGFTMIEMLIVLAIIAIMALMMLPTIYPHKTRVQISESIGLAHQLKPNIQYHHRSHLSFPESNTEAGLPEANKIIGNFITSASIQDGAIHLNFGHKINSKLHGKVLSLRPIYVVDSPLSPISWVCGHSTIPEGMAASGENLTNIPSEFLPVDCR